MRSASSNGSTPTTMAFGTGAGACVTESLTTPTSGRFMSRILPLRGEAMERNDLVANGFGSPSVGVVMTPLGNASHFLLIWDFSTPWAELLLERVPMVYGPH